MRHIQFGLTLPSANATDLSHPLFFNSIRAAIEMVTGHFDSVWLPDHLQFASTPIFESWTMLTYLAASYPQLRYGHLVLCQLFRNPALLAKMAATLQHMSQGQFILGLGAGSAEDEALAYDFSLPTAGQRVNALEEQLQIITSLWREDRVSFSGTYHQITEASCLPHPEPLPPVLIAAFQPRMLRLAARYADWWNTGMITPEEARTHIQALDAACEAVGRDPKTLRRTILLNCSCATTEARLKMLKDTHTSPFGPGLVGKPAQIVEQLQAYVELGFDYFMFMPGGLPRDLTTLELLTHEVLPTLNKLYC
ncbi:LLM class flavin-dependent oxidoreductase [Ktedonosporobacter rubrisoli]|uniref:LLM class flavin-dependent oxidoreductase n=1 Tax=Ktedonosporobacter rubrisoli TaxID=2509675 RepID=A0A4P6JQ68_KTERU|nr:LLM class flavin-dependent oxidoreductase [Ktedonosporobacter rubrisoli]QBD77424.1 LLM class flavin-dependent oxidoreductase [Ktedonosporobacter rubrisoli]